MSFLGNYYNEQAAQQEIPFGLTIGTVVDTNDPQQRGRVRVMCPALGDRPEPSEMDVDSLPWAIVIGTSGGSVDQGFKDNGTPIEDEVSYGFVSPVKIGAQAIVSIVDNNYSVRVVLGFFHEVGAMGTMPHGRYKAEGGKMSGPYGINGKPIEPLFSNGMAAFSNSGFGASDPQAASEWMSRGADFTVGAARGDNKRSTQADDDDEAVVITEADGSKRVITQGYGLARTGEMSEMSGTRDAKYEPQTHSWSSPGLHAIAMDDRRGNSRMRFRSSTGHQILLDDTNERIYIATNKGGNWIEMDSCGNIDVHSDTRISIHGSKDINLTAGETIRLSAKALHFCSDQETRFNSIGDFNVHSNANIRAGAMGSMYLQTAVNMHQKIGSMLYITTGSTMHLKSGAQVFTTSAGTNETKAGGNIINSAPQIHNNSMAAGAAAEAELAAEKPAYRTNRIPQHEPWPRMMIDSTRANMVNEEAKSPEDSSKWAVNPIGYDGSKAADFEFKSFNDPNIGRIENGVAYVRNKHWHR